MDNLSKKLISRGETTTATTIPSSLTDARFLQSLLLATPLYFYYPHLTPPGFFSGLLKGLVQMRNATVEEQNVFIECGIDLTSGRDVSSRTSSTKRKSIGEGKEQKAKRSKGRSYPSPKDSNSPEQTAERQQSQQFHNVSPSFP